MNARIAALGAAVLLASAACGATDVPPSATRSPQAVTVSYDFSEGDHGWQADFADFSEQTRPQDTVGAISELPPGAPNDLEGPAFQVAASNRSDDVFMFITRQLTTADGLAATTEYQISFEITFLSDAPTGCFGVGGAPGESVYLKAGATNEQPTVVEADGEFRMNVDKGNQAQGGPAATVAGDVANGIPCEEALGIEPPPFGEVTHEHVHEPTVTSGQDGTLWLMVGADSGFEARTTLYFLRIDVTLTPVG